MRTLYATAHLINTDYAKILQITREEKADKDVDTTTVTCTDGASLGPAVRERSNRLSRSRSRRRAVTDAGQTKGNNELNKTKTTPPDSEIRQNRKLSTNDTTSGHNYLAPPTITSSPPSPQEIPTNGHAASSPTSTNRPTAGGVAFPFKLGTHLNDNGRNASVVTLQSQAGVVTPKGDEKGRQLGESMGNRSAEGRQPDKGENVEQTKSKEAVGQEEWRQAPQEKKMRDIAGDDQEENADDKRGTLEDTKGVLHDSPTEGGRPQFNGNGNAEGKRPLADRSDTASLD